MKKVNRAELAEVLGVSLPTIDSKVKKGMPYVSKGSRGKGWEFDLTAVIEWEKKQFEDQLMGNIEALDIDELKKRKLAAETILAEIMTAEKRGQVAEIAGMEKIWTDLMIEFRTRVRQLPNRLSSMLTGLDDETEIKQILRVELDEALTVLSTLDLDEEEA